MIIRSVVNSNCFANLKICNKRFAARLICQPFLARGTGKRGFVPEAQEEVISKLNSEHINSISTHNKLVVISVVLPGEKSASGTLDVPQATQ